MKCTGNAMNRKKTVITGSGKFIADLGNAISPEKNYKSCRVMLLRCKKQLSLIPAMPAYAVKNNLILSFYYL